MDQTDRRSAHRRVGAATIAAFLVLLLLGAHARPGAGRHHCPAPAATAAPTIEPSQTLPADPDPDYGGGDDPGFGHPRGDGDGRFGGGAPDGGGSSGGSDGRFGGGVPDGGADGGGGSSDGGSSDGGSSDGGTLGGDSSDGGGSPLAQSTGGSQT